jgi:hypothetical protein
VETLHQQQVAIAIDGETRPAFRGAMEQPVAVRIFGVQPRKEFRPRCEGDG